VAGAAGVRTGEGKYTFAKGKGSYEGTYHDNIKEGQGKMVYPDKSSYVGGWVVDKRAGEGVYKYANGDVYKGSWAADVKAGLGSYFFKDSKSTFMGTWANGLLVDGEWYAPLARFVRLRGRCKTSPNPRTRELLLTSNGTWGDPTCSPAMLPTKAHQLQAPWFIHHSLRLWAIGSAQDPEGRDGVQGVVQGQQACEGLVRVRLYGQRSHGSIRQGRRLRSNGHRVVPPFPTPTTLAGPQSPVSCTTVRMPP
jgi:hypothetical protein